ncbi:MAG: low-specificity L-threonine aldolase [Candidatus Nitronauta litoralis]|uniref:Low-specificity L-threonine aldolase n=1 Tax=Candidatus Nitronauta litoralis TaxID=2705533 RepID=A0A7T0G0T0_9BACT|nr:MAG: low-specificity L-threonine aldolase [Candidatus Nitronauta litoralis]
MPSIDLRSDTVTQPTDAMREAMAKANVGDDVLDEDPTVHELQDLAADMLGKEAALFVPSGTMGNLISVLAHCGRGDEILLGDRSHIFLNEVGGVAAFGGVHPRTLPNESDGTLPLDLIRQSVRAPDLHYPPTRLLCLENTHNYCNGSPLSGDYMREAKLLAEQTALNVHLDGARLFNAAVALGIDVKDLTCHVDSVVVCLSKGLSAPVGSLMAGNHDFIDCSRKLRKMAGGGMRQAGHLAAAGLISLKEQVHRLGEDHQNAKTLAEGIAAIKGLAINTDEVKTNIIFFKMENTGISPGKFVGLLKENGILILEIEPFVFRAVTHRQITPELISRALDVMQRVLKTNK